MNKNFVDYRIRIDVIDLTLLIPESRLKRITYRLLINYIVIVSINYRLRLPRTVRLTIFFILIPVIGYPRHSYFNYALFQWNFKLIPPQLCSCYSLNILESCLRPLCLVNTSKQSGLRCPLLYKLETLKLNLQLSRLIILYLLSLNTTRELKGLLSLGVCDF